MRVSKDRLEESIQLRDIAKRLVELLGEDTSIPAYGGRYRVPVRKVRVNGLTIGYSCEHGEDLLDIWQGRKVFSIAWNAGETPYVVAFHPGSWQDILRAISRTPLRNSFRLH
jgi:hypothetical protein